MMVEEKKYDSDLILRLAVAAYRWVIVPQGRIWLPVLSLCFIFITVYNMYECVCVRAHWACPCVIIRTPTSMCQQHLLTHEHELTYLNVHLFTQLWQWPPCPHKYSFNMILVTNCSCKLLPQTQWNNFSLTLWLSLQTTWKGTEKRQIYWLFQATIKQDVSVNVPSGAIGKRAEGTSTIHVIVFSWVFPLNEARRQMVPSFSLSAFKQPFAVYWNFSDSCNHAFALHFQSTGQKTCRLEKSWRGMKNRIVVGHVRSLHFGFGLVTFLFSSSSFLLHSWELVIPTKWDSLVTHRQRSR